VYDSSSSSSSSSSSRSSVEGKCHTVTVVLLSPQALRGKVAQLVQYGTFLLQVVVSLSYTRD